MPRYRVLIKQDEYRNCFVEADGEDQAKERVLDGEFGYSDFVGSENTEVIDVEGAP